MTPEQLGLLHRLLAAINNSDTIYNELETKNLTYSVQTLTKWVKKKLAK